MVHEKQIDEFVSRLQGAAGTNLQSVILYGSAADGEFHSQYSNINLLCILREISFAALRAMAPPVEWWTRKNHRPPLVLSSDELQRSADVFSIELTDIKHRHRVLFGDDLLRGLTIPLHLHRAQLEYELREKVILLRQQALLAAGNGQRTWELMLGSFSAFVTLLRHALIAMGNTPPDSKREAITVLAEKVPFDPSAFLQLLDIREQKAQRKQLDVDELFSRYLAAVQQITAAVDRMLDSFGPQS